MNANRVAGLLTAFLVVLATVGIAAGGARLDAPAAPTSAPWAAGTATAVSIRPVAATPASPAPPSPTDTPTRAPRRLEPTSPASTPLPSATPTEGPLVASEQVIGYSVAGQPIAAYRFGQGPIKVVLIGDIHGEYEANTNLLAQQLVDHFQAHPGQVPARSSLWIIPTMNPDGLANGHRWNEDDVDLNRNADTDLDGCAGNDWSSDTVGLEGDHPGAGGAYPFSEPEARAVRDFLADAWVAVFYHSAAEAIFADTCQRHEPSGRLAKVLSSGTGYPVPEEGWTGYRLTGEFGDYLAGEGVAAVTVELTDHEDPELERNLKGIQVLLAAVDEILSVEAAQVGARYVWLDESNTGSWRYPENSFVHPIALEVLGNSAYLLDGGRVLAQELDQPRPLELLLAPGDYVDDVRVLEPLDLAADGTSLLALDRAGDVYRYDPAAGTWALERYARPPGDTYDHYYVALTAVEQAHYLLETSHEQVWRFADGEKGAPLVKLPQSRDVDVSANSDGVYVLTRAMNNPTAALLRYRDSRRVSGFQPNVDLMHPRQVIATESMVHVLDRAGRRVVSLDPQSGALQALYQFIDRRGVGAVWADASGERLILAGRDALYFYGEPDQQATIDGGPVLEGPQPHDLALLESLRGLAVPIQGARITTRDFQMPGAPRHYRLGVHEGIDFYGHTVGVAVNRRTPVQAVADGEILRAMVDYQAPTAAQVDAWSAQSRALGYTPPDVLDGYRGQQVWIDHGGGLVSRYAHLGSIASDVKEGASVVEGQPIATVGNSGTPASVRSQTEDVHLHLELWLGDNFVGQFLRPIEAREWLERILR